MNKYWLVVVNNKALGLSPYIEKYKLFKEQDTESMLAWAKKNGWDSPMGINTAVGQMNFCKGGDVDISIILLPVQG